MKVAILFDEILPEDVLADRDVLQQVKIVTESLKRLGHEYVLVPCTLDLGAVKATVVDSGASIAFNLLDTLDSQDCLAHLPVALLDAMRFPHTGPTAYDLATTTRKLSVKDKLRELHIKYPRYITLQTYVSIDHLKFREDVQKTRWLIKGANEDGSFAMTDDSVVSGSVVDIQTALSKWELVTGRRAFAEEYIDGREFTVPFLGMRMLPVIEVTYDDYPKDKPKILAQAAKWQVGSFEHEHTGSRVSGNDESCVVLMQALAQECVSYFQLYNGWGRIDFRVSDTNVPYVIDINSNCCLAPDAWFAESLAAANITMDQAIQTILEDAS